MKALQAWLLRWLGAVSVSDSTFIKTATKLEILEEALKRQHEEHQAAIAELIQELNDLRNSMPAVAQSTSRPVRVFRNFREFRTVVESQKPIRIERTS